MTSIPETLYLLPESLRVLQLKSTNISSIDEAAAFGGWDFVQNLLLTDNKLTSVPEIVGISLIDFSRNPIETADLSRLSYVNTVLLNSCGTKNIRGSISNKEFVWSIYMNNNSIKSLPEIQHRRSLDYSEARISITGSPACEAETTKFKPKSTYDLFCPESACAPDCVPAVHGGNGYCDPECNYPACEFELPECNGEMEAL